MVETYRCADSPASANRIGTSGRLGRERWFVRRYGARFIIDPRGGLRGGLDARPDGRVRLVLSYPRPAWRRTWPNGRSQPRKRSAVGLPARDCWTGSDPWGGVGMAVHIPTVAVPYQAPGRDGSLPATALRPGSASANRAAVVQLPAIPRLGERCAAHNGAAFPCTATPM